jgi:predicted TIM-barrel fold metal-dependent hydrolase
MTVDALVVAAPNLFRSSAPLHAIVTQAATHGIRAVVAAPGRPPAYALPPANDALAEAARGLLGVARLGRVDPLQGAAAVREVRRCLTELRCNGIFLHPGEEAFPLRAAVAVVAEAASHGATTVIATGHYGLSEPLQVLQLADAVPGANIVMTSGGQINISGLGMIDAWAALQRNDRLHVMVNGEYRQDYIERLVSDLDPRRVLFGSFSPYYDQGFELERVRSARMSDASRSLLEGGNAARLFVLDGQPDAA